MIWSKKNQYKYFIEHTGNPCKGFPPWPPQHLPGGGAVIPWKYHTEVKDGSEQSIPNKVCAAVEAMEEKSVLKIKICYIQKLVYVITHNQ